MPQLPSRKKIKIIIIIVQTQSQIEGSGKDDTIIISGINTSTGLEGVFVS